MFALDCRDTSSLNPVSEFEGHPPHSAAGYGMCILNACLPHYIAWTATLLLLGGKQNHDMRLWSSNILNKLIFHNSYIQQLTLVAILYCSYCDGL